MAFDSTLPAWDINQIFADLERQMIINRKEVLTEAKESGRDNFKAFALNSFSRFAEANRLSAVDALKKATQLTQSQFGKAAEQGAKEVDERILAAKKLGFTPKYEPEKDKGVDVLSVLAGALAGFAAVLTQATVSAQKQLALIVANVDPSADDLDKEIDRAQRGFLEKGIVGKVDKNGNEKSMSAEAEFIFRNEADNAYKSAGGQRRAQYGESLVIISAHPSCCPLCLPWQNKLVVDDVFGEGSPDGVHELMSTAIAAGFNHFNCRHSWADAPEGWEKLPVYERSTATPRETAERYVIEQRQRYNERQIRKYKNMALAMESPENSQNADRKVREWQARQRVLAEYAKERGIPFYRQYSREQIGGETVPTARGIVWTSSTSAEGIREEVGRFRATEGIRLDPDIPKTLDEYEKLRYNNPKEFEELNEYVASVERDAIHPVTGFGFYKNLRREVEDNLFGVKTANGVEIKEQTFHLTEKMLGEYAVSYDDKNNKSVKISLGVTVSELKDVLLNGTPGEVMASEDGELSFTITLSKNGFFYKASINPQRGRIIQVSKDLED